MTATIPAAAFRWRDVVAAPWAVWALVVVNGLLLGAYAFLVPVFRAPDEPQHIDMVIALTEEVVWPDPGERMLSVRMRNALRVADFHGSRSPEVPDGSKVGRGPLFAETALPREARPSFNELGTDAPTTQVNQMVQHPPLYYLVMAGAATALVDLDAWPYDQSVVVLRLLSALLVLPLPLLAHAAARRLAGPGPVALAAAVATLAIPQLTHLGSVVNSDNLVTLAGACLTMLLAFVATGDTSRWTALWVGLVIAVGLLTKGFAFVLPPLAILGYGLAWWRVRKLRAVTSLLLALLIGVGGGGWWWVRNVMRLGVVQPVAAEYPDAPADFQPDVLWYWTERIPRGVGGGFWGAFGWFEVSLPVPVVVTAAAVMVVGLAFAVSAWGGTRRWSGADALLLVAPAVGGLAALLFRAYRFYLRSGSAVGTQGRYLLYAALGLLVAAVLGYGRVAGRRARWVPRVLFLVALVLQVLSLALIFTTFWGPPDGSAVETLGALAAWTPIAAEIPVLLGVALVAATGAAAVAIVLGSPRPRGRHRGDGSIAPAP